MRNQKLLGVLSMAIALPVIFAGCAIGNKCGLRGCPGDAQITTNVQSSFDQHPEIGPEVSVKTLDHVVYLSGFVAAGEMKTVAEDVARATPDVSKVVNSIAVTH